MNVIPAALGGVKIIEPQLFGDARGYFFETYNEKALAAAGIVGDFVQDNESFSAYGVLRGLHYQRPPFTQAKLVRVIAGRVLDVVVDIRRDSPTFGRHLAVELSGENKRILYAPRGMAHGFVVLSESACFAYKCDNFYAPTHERCIRFDDPELGIAWPIPAEKCTLSGKDLQGVAFKDAEIFTEY